MVANDVRNHLRLYRTSPLFIPPFNVMRRRRPNAAPHRLKQELTPLMTLPGNVI